MAITEENKLRLKLEKYEERIRQLEEIELKRNKAEQKILHLNNVLRTIRNVNQLISVEKNREKLITGACKNLTEFRGYFNAWIALFDRYGKFDIAKESMLGEAFYEMRSLLSKGELTHCAKEVLSRDKVLTINNPIKECNDCPLAHKYEGRAAMSCKIAYNNTTYGLLSVSIPLDYADDTEEKKLLQEIATDLGLALHNIESQERIHLLDHVVEILPQPLSFLSKDYRYVTVNDVYAEFYDLKVNQITGRFIHELIDKKTFFQEVKPMLDKCFSGEIINYEVEVNFKGKGKRFMDMTYYPYKDQQGNIVGVVSHGRDITKEIKARKTLNKEKEKFHSYVKNAPYGIFLANEKGQYTDINEAACIITGYSKGELLKMNLLDLIPENGTPLAQEHFQNLQKNGIADGEIPFLRKEGTLRYWNVKAVKLSDNQFLGFVNDITDRIIATQRLKESQKRLHLAMESANEGVWEWDFSTGLVSFDKNALSMLGYDKKMPLQKGEWWIDQIHPQDRKACNEAFNNMITGQSENYDVEFRLKAKNNSYIWVSSNAKVIRFKDDASPLLAVGIHRDITEQKLARKQISESENKFRSLVEQAAEMLFLHDLEGNILDVNKATEKNTGYSREELLKMNVFDIDPDAKSRNDQKTYWQKINIGDPIENIEVRHKRKDGSIYEAEISFSKVRLEEGNFMLVLARDISERKKAEQELKMNKERFDLAMNATRDGLFDWNLVTNEIYYSPGWKSMLGYKMNELPNDFSVWEKLTKKEDVKKSFEEINKAINKETDRYKMEFQMKHKDGHWVDIFARAEVFFDKKGKALRVVGTHIDITQRNKDAKKLREALEKAEESDKLKSAFLANMSHEIRTPLNGILGFSDLLKTTEAISDQQHKYISIIEKSGNRLLSTINDLISISRIESGQMEIHISKVNINEIIKELFLFFKPEAESRNIKLYTKTELDNNAAYVNTDKEKLYAIFTNLIKNALKFTQEGEISFGYEYKNNSLACFVKDTGIGIDPDRQEAIFERFVQADLNSARSSEGSGLGLSITKAYAELLESKIQLKSEKGKGSIFFFDIPFKKQDTTLNINGEGDEIIELSPELKKRSLLIVEDEASSGLFLTEILNPHFKKLYLATNGIEAIEHHQKNKPDIILMDIKMHGMDGITATKKIRETDKEVYIIAQTAYALAGDEQKVLDAGCNAYLTKPLKKSTLFKALNELLI